MSFSTVGANPAWGVVTTAPITTYNGVNLNVFGMDDDSLSIVDVGSTFTCGAVNTSGVNKPLSGWITYSGGGGSTRPTSGLLYPRGNS